jgi:heat shock protein HslJ
MKMRPELLLWGLMLLLAACGSRQEPAANGDIAQMTDEAPVGVEAEAPVATDDDKERFRARGNEPGWMVEIGTETSQLVTQYGESKATFATPEPTQDDGATVYEGASDKGPVVVRIMPGPCYDGMSGMPYPKQVTVELSGETLKGCGGEPHDLLTGDEWIVDEIAGEGLAPDSNVTINFTAEGRALGSASCNSFSSAFKLSGEGLSFAPAATTRRACEPALMQQESRFLDALTKVDRFEIGDDDGLILHSTDTPVITAHRG